MKSIGEAIGKIGGKEVVPRLVEMLDDGEIDAHVRGSIAKAIGKLGDKEVVLQMLSNEGIDERVRCDIAGAIENQEIKK